MAIEIQGAGFVGISFEATWGTFVAPSIFFPVRNVDLLYTQDTSWRRPIRGLADNLGGIQGYSSVQGSIEMELMENILPYFLYTGRYGVVKSGAAIDFTYTATPTAWSTNASLPATKKGLSITVVKSGQVFGFEGCITTGIEFGVDGATPTVTFSIIGEDEASAALPTYVENVNSLVYGAGQWNIQIPTSSQVFDADGISVAIEEGAEAQHRLSDKRRPEFIKFGERTVTASVDRDFVNRTDYDAFKALTATSLRLLLTRSATRSVDIVLPRAVPETYEPSSLSSQGDLVRSSVQYQGVYDTATSASHSIIVKTHTDIA